MISENYFEFLRLVFFVIIINTELSNSSVKRSAPRAGPVIIQQNEFNKLSACFCDPSCQRVNSSHKLDTMETTSNEGIKKNTLNRHFECGISRKESIQDIPCHRTYGGFNATFNDTYLSHYSGETACNGSCIEIFWNGTSVEVKNSSVRSGRCSTNIASSSLPPEGFTTSTPSSLQSGTSAVLTTSSLLSTLSTPLTTSSSQLSTPLTTSSSPLSTPLTTSSSPQHFTSLSFIVTLVACIVLAIISGLLILALLWKRKKEARKPPHDGRSAENSIVNNNFIDREHLSASSQAINKSTAQYRSSNLAMGTDEQNDTDYRTVPCTWLGNENDNDLSSEFASVDDANMVGVYSRLREHVSNVTETYDTLSKVEQVSDLTSCSAVSSSAEKCSREKVTPEFSVKLQSPGNRTPQSRASQNEISSVGQPMYSVVEKAAKSYTATVTRPHVVSDTDQDCCDNNHGNKSSTSALENVYARLGQHANQTTDVYDVLPKMDTP